MKLYIVFYTNVCVYTGQFWNIPIRVNDGIFSMIEINETESSNYRSFNAISIPQTYDGTHRVCYYAGKSAVEGTYTQYQTDSLFDTAFTYTQFDNEKCKCELKLFFHVKNIYNTHQNVNCIHNNYCQQLYEVFMFCKYK